MLLARSRACAATCLSVLFALFTFLGVSCGSKSSSNESNSPPKKETQDVNLNQRFGTVLNGFSAEGTTVSYALGHTLGSGTLPNDTADNIRFYCSLNGSPFERCLAQGNIPSSRLLLGINVFQAQVVVYGKESANPVYHEFVIGGPGLR